ncbi:MAG: nicotinamide mononucleotide transporter [Acidobacteria bacterium]|nr:nicotinamide mononucleotide transporter [Acidobacteriota bacterium]
MVSHRIEKAAVGLGALSAAILLLAAERQWIAISLTEALGFVTGVGCVYLVVKQNIWNFPIGIANNLFFLVLFSRARLYGDAGLQIVYLLLAVHGWYQWWYGGIARSVLRVARISRSGLGLVIFSVIVMTGLLVGILRLVNGAAPWLDAFTTALSLGAQYLLNRKLIETWWLWITADVLYVWLYLARGLPLTAALYGIFLALCVMGWRAWQRALVSA